MYRYVLVISGGVIAVQDAGRTVRARLGQLAEARPGLVARLQLFGLLILLVPLFAGLRYMVGEGISRVEIRIVPQDVPVIVPVERIVERVIERIIYVPVPDDSAAETVPTPTAQPGGLPTPSGADPSGAGAPSASSAGPEDTGSVPTGEAGPDGLTAVGASLADSRPGPLAPGVPAPSVLAGGVGAPSIVQLPPSLPEPADAKPPEATDDTGLATVGTAPVPRRVATAPVVIIASEDRLGVPGVPGAAQQRGTDAQQGTGQANGNGNGNTNSNDNRSPRNTRSQITGGGQAAQAIATAVPPAAPIGSKLAVEATPVASAPVVAGPSVVGPSTTRSQAAPPAMVQAQADDTASVAAVGATEAPQQHDATPMPPRAVPRARSATSRSADAGSSRQSAIPAPIGVKPAPED